MLTEGLLIFTGLVASLQQFNTSSTNNLPRPTLNPNLQLQNQPCPVNCSCAPDYNAYGLSMACPSRQGDLETLPKEINALIATFSSGLRSLSIKDTQLVGFPMEICNSSPLETLNLENAGLTELPDSCFTLLRNLRSLAIVKNNIKFMQVLKCPFSIPF